MRKTGFLIFALIVVALFASACTLSASTPVSPTATDIQEDIEDLFNKGATEAAAALTEQASQDGGEDKTEDTPEGEEEATATPEPEDEEEPTATPTLDFERTVPDEYTVKQGEFPYCIARRFDIDIDDLLSANGLTRNSSVFPGEKLTIPQSADAYAGERALLDHPAEYSVVSGDTLAGIACKFGDVYPEEIAQLNGKGENYEPAVGDTLSIP